MWLEEKIFTLNTKLLSFILLYYKVVQSSFNKLKNVYTFLGLLTYVFVNCKDIKNVTDALKSKRCKKNIFKLLLCDFNSTNNKLVESWGCRGLVGLFTTHSAKGRRIESPSFSFFYLLRPSREET